MGGRCYARSCDYPGLYFELLKNMQYDVRGSRWRRVRPLRRTRWSGQKEGRDLTTKKNLEVIC